MNVSPVSAAYLPPSDFPVATAAGPELGAADFLRLLVVQLTSQDPLSPMDDTSFISQMSSFTSLEQMRMLSADFAAFRQNQEGVAAQSYLGRHVTWEGSGETVDGVVEAVVLEEGRHRLIIGDRSFDPSGVVKITDRTGAHGGAGQENPENE